MKYNLNDFVTEIDALFSEVEQELANRMKGIEGDGTIEQLVLIINEMKQIRKLAASNKLPPIGERYTAFTWYIVDSWNNDSILGERLCELANNYRKKLD